MYTVPCDSCLDNIMKFRLLQPDLDTTTPVVYRSESIAVERPNLPAPYVLLDLSHLKIAQRNQYIDRMTSWHFEISLEVA